MTYMEAIDHIEAGGAVRRACWPEGVYIDSRIARAVYREEMPYPVVSTPFELLNATDWEEYAGINRN